jgi:hypothetical protein
MSARTAQRVLYSKKYFDDHVPLAHEVKAQTENDRRHEAERDGRDSCSLAYRLHQYGNHAREECILNEDSTTLQYEGSREKPYVMVSHETYEKNKKQHIHLKVLPEEGHAKGFDAKLMTVSSAAGTCLSFVIVLQNKGMEAGTYKSFPLQGFAPDGKAMGYAVVVPSTKGVAMNKVFEWYFETVVLRHIDTTVTESTTGAGDEQPNFLFTFDGETPQLQSLDANLLKKFEARNVTVMKLPASFSAIGQPSDVVASYMMLKLLIKQHKNYGVLSPYLKRSFEALQDLLASDPDAASWRDTFLQQLEICLDSIAPNLAVAFAYPIIMKTYQKMAWSPAGNPQPILRRTKDVSEDTVQDMLKAWPILLDLCK